MTSHYLEHHKRGNSTEDPDLKVTVLAKGMSHAKRKIYEALTIAEKQPKLNRRGEQTAETCLYIGMTEEERRGYRKVQFEE